MKLMPNTVVATGAASDVQVVPGMVVFGGAGGRSNEGRLQLDGISVGSAFNGGGVSAYIADVGNAQEVALTSSGGLGEAEVGGPSMNVVPKTGGNTVKGSVYLSGVTKGMIGSNYTDDLKARGLSTPGSTTKVWDFNGAVGGPIKKDRLWFFYTLRDEGNHKTVPGMFANLNAGDPTKWTYAPDLNRPAVQAASFRTTSLRLTSQATPRNQVRVFWDEQMPCEGAAWPGSTATACRHSGDNEIIAGGTAAPTPAASATAAPETASYRHYGTRFRQVSWQSPITSRLLAEASVGNYASRYLGNTMPGSPAFDFIQVTEQCAAGCPANDNRAGLVYRGGTFAQGSAWQGSNNWRASLSYVEGKHSMKFGYQGGYLMQDSFPYTNSQFMTFRVNNGVPNQINEIIDYNAVQQRVQYDAFYAQDQWTMGRITLQGALRFDRATSIFPEVTIGGVRFLPTVISFPETKGVDAYKDLTPRGGVAIDLFGDGKTALKFNFGRYLEAAQNGGLFIASRPSSRISTTASRTWTDSNGNFRPDCDLLNNAAQTVVGGDFCGAVANTNFGKALLDTTQDPALLSGWGVRSGDWQWGASVQRQIAAAGVGRAQLPPPLAAEFRRHRQPRDRRGRPRQVHHFSPGRRAAAGRRRICHPRHALQREPVQGVGGGQQLRDARFQLRPTEPDVECDRAQRERAAPERPRHSGRLQHEQHIVRLLRAPCGDSRADHPRRQQPDQSVLRLQHGLDHALHGARLLHDSADRRADRRDHAQR